MALDKQKILSELGSVMNQLQSADCGCMGKLFGNTTSPVPIVSNPSEGYNHGCCHCHHNHFQGSCSGEPCHTMPVQHMNQSCMGRCNPEKLYNETYQYLNNNLMQPVVQEVYNDLKTITPANTVMNNQSVNASQGHTNMQLMKNNDNFNSEKNSNLYHSQMPNLDPRMAAMGRGNMINSGGINGPESQINEMGGPMGGGGYYMNGGGGQSNAAGTGHINAPGNQVGGAGEHVNRAAGQLSGMGPNIINMMMGGRKAKTGGQPMDGGPLTQPMVIDAPQSPHGQIGLTPIPAQMSPHETTDRLQHATNQQLNNYQKNFNNPNQNESHAPNIGHPVQQMAPDHNAYGQHAHGIAKFNEMFPGVMKNFGGDLNFDPMAIAVQMNPANHQRAAIETMQKVMNGNNGGINKMLNPSNNAQSSNLGRPDETKPLSNIPPNQLLTSNGLSSTLNTSQPTDNQPKIINDLNQNQLNYSYGAEAEQQVYTVTKQPLLQQQVQGNDQQIMDQPAHPNANAIATPPPHYSPNEGQVINTRNPKTQHLTPESRPLSALNQIREQPLMEREPIFPANVSHNQSYSHMKKPPSYTYNTLGQPIEMLPAPRYHLKDPGGPQTLSPQDLPSKSIHDPRMYSNVKSTVSKTSIMGNRPVGRNSSKSQLQNIYNQYKGSQSFTQQNILGRTEGGSHSEGMLNVPQQRAERIAPNQQVIIEKVGGDTLTENEANNNDAAKKQIAGGQNGDVGNIDKIQNNAVSEQPNPNLTAKARNGLQDIVYTSYPTSAAWSFHGRPRPAFPISPRSRVQY